ncbi:hypothetical protein J4Q44_G00205620 [Coregonus suidteri]|uniref:Uncharacterized protein n=1 Tax=Coregonus suidteri TaxID=861788 RepID=A0AAN8LGT5_9TELE
MDEPTPLRDSDLPRVGNSLGGLPHGIIFAQSIFEGLQLLKEILAEDAFAGRGQRSGRALSFSIRRLKAERGASGLPGGNPSCVFHLLQAVWRWLWSKEHGVEMKDMQALFSIVKDMLYARDMDKVKPLHHLALVNTVAVRSV